MVSLSFLLFKYKKKEFYFLNESLKNKGMVFYEKSLESTKRGTSKTL